MKRSSFFIIFLFAIVISLSGQVNINIDREAGIDVIENLHKEAWKEVGTTAGYRVQVASLSGANSRINIEKMKEDFEKQFEDIPTHIIYSEPHFRFRIGDFYTRLEAYHCLKRIIAVYPGAYIVSDEILFKEEEDIFE